MGLIKTAAKAAVASSVHGRVQRRQQTKWAAQDEAKGLSISQPPGYAGMVPQADRIGQLHQLGELHSSGVLTQAEFEQEKARILNA